MGDSRFRQVGRGQSAGTTDRKPTLLIVEDDLRFRETLVAEFTDRGYDVQQAGSLQQVKDLEARSFRFCILDLRVGNENGLTILEQIRTDSPHCRVVILTGYGSIATAVKAVKCGAVNYLTKPVAVEVLEKALWVDLRFEDSEALPDEKATLARHEREYIEFVLSQCGGNVSKAAQWLGLHRQSLQRKLRKYPPGK